ncbi:ATP-dependent DNA helicase DinG [Lysinibacillus sphaericus]|uniref:3'-5' exonuclease DinG n=1 Tax=Lysinibacillus sphaericus TaxID=1421 RepID=A0A2S0K2K5_LYSSH|nr:ATP-dependent DNA helicase DinG [Lysinibacillus sphaericus]AVK97558.1 ATP-dependent helicase DinG [Lysinibacillus sphaericus]MED4545576.1 ATP-dependent DNA helicase DinG [Lysinibacillus sphaericus]TKI17760.1 ATP-dependent DNA helicase DinG [Lysinibacillus sphaericus]SUV16529.1 DnaQ family exonuclease/DinG family helicase [Lysinibacillus sphaericus]GEC82405.1 ATP-dependent helicase DinG [Lysinibacillus sphaericus]
MMESQKYAIVDLETTGHSPANGDRMIQIAIVIMKDWKIERTYTKFIHPGKSIPSFIQDLTHITDEDVKDALPFEAHADYIYELISDCVFVAHNTDFDLSFLQAEFKRAGLPKWHGKKMDTVELAKILFPMSLSFKLGDLAADLNIELENAHRADDDALATAELFKRSWKELLSLPQLTLEQMHKRSFRLKSNLSQLFFEALQLKRHHRTTDENITYYRNIAICDGRQKRVLKSELAPYPKTINEKEALMTKAMPNFEQRPAQFTMMDTIWQALNDKEECVIEASTGIGKTVGYLLPSILYARANNKKIAISTYTAHLQEQLVEEELLKIEKILDTKVNVAVLKGMQHYIDLARFEQCMAYADESYDDTFTILQLLVWLTKTQTGVLSELNVSGGGQLFLEKIRKLPEEKPTKGFDFYEQALKNSTTADCIVTNHSMVISDLVRQTPIFRQIDGWIIDEAHQVIQAAMQQDETVFSYTQWKYIFGQIGTMEDTALFQQFSQAAKKKQRIPMQSLQQLDKQFIRLQRVFDDTIGHAVQKMQQQVRGKQASSKCTLFLEDVSLAKEPLLQVSKLLQHWLDLAVEAGKAFENNIEQLDKNEVFILSEWHYWIREMKLRIAEWEEIFLLHQDEHSVWFEFDLRSVPGSLHVYKKPVNVTPIIEKVMAPLRKQASIVWTSGTLTVPGNERFITRQLGISDSVQVMQLQAPASYYSGAKAFIVTDMPDIQQVTQADYIEAVAHAITRTVRMTEGRCFVLFTAQDMLRKTVELIQDSELLDDYMLFAQGVTGGSRMRILKSFQKFNQAVLFGTNSFWEGVDVPGDALSSVIVVRLPFSSPEEPVFKARAKHLTLQGHNSFTELSLPEAIMRFKQGFGRLIRSSQDKGAFIVLDRRISTKSYGKEFIHALPPIDVKKLQLPELLKELSNWQK